MEGDRYLASTDKYKIFTWRRNSVLILLTPSCSPDLLSLSRASISSMKMIEGWRCLTTFYISLVPMPRVYRNLGFRQMGRPSQDDIDVPGDGKEGLDKLLSLPQPLAGQAA